MLLLLAAFQDSAHAGAAIVAHGGAGVDLYGTTDFAAASASWETQIKNAGALGIDCNDGMAHVYVARLSNLKPNQVRDLSHTVRRVTPECPAVRFDARIQQLLLDSGAG